MLETFPSTRVHGTAMAAKGTLALAMWALLALSCCAQMTLPADGDVSTAAAAPFKFEPVVAPASGVPNGDAIGTTDPELLAMIPQLDISTITNTIVRGPARGRYTADGTLVGIAPKATNNEVAAAATDGVTVAQTNDRINNQMCLQASATAQSCITSPNGRFRACLQTDSNFVLYDGSTPYWATNTANRISNDQKPIYFCSQADGNIVAYQKDWRAYWASNTCCRGRPAPITTYIQNDGNLVAYDSTCTAVWATNTVRAAGVTPPCSGTPPQPPASNWQTEVLNLVNTARRNNGNLPPLVLNSALNGASQKHSDNMRNRNFFSHDEPAGGLNFGDRMRRDLPSMAGRCALGENIAKGYTSPSAVVQGWMNSAGHRANILNASYRAMGIGRANPGEYWTQLFSSCTS